MTQHDTGSLVPPEEPETLVVPLPAEASLDWKAIVLGLLAFLFLIGLIPLWYFVYSAWAG